MKKIIQAFVIMTIFFMSSLGHAQLGGLGGLKDAMGGGNSSGGGNALELQGELILGLGIAMQSFMKANEKFLSALDLDAKAREAAEKGNITPTKENEALGEVIDFAIDAAADLKAARDKGVKLSAEGKKDYADGLLPYALGMAAMVKMAKIAPDFLKASADEIKSIKNPMQIMKIKKQFDLGMKTGKRVPEVFKLLGETSKTVFAFAKEIDINLDKVKKETKKQPGGDQIPGLSMG